ncbi:hypothetical protein DF044_09650 [Burkholderia contaminans]|uniref:Uncharacterized protein n=1 Tax=Burkholderia contaminans TaxID=488447 RepID=A0A3N8R5J5_9BURK|nr:hypothetical protein [Burkholderia contaminans]RQT15145.1 hypothetical protein DF044_09650 [Burkholderia contaminans]RQT31145.1 hypothetical protein DF037_12320 [Burkholderia contaminans]HEM7875119.1 hypothetical protein [Burkholderia contaminans]
MQNFDTSFGTLGVVNEPTYSFSSMTNTRFYAHEVLLTEYGPASIHGVTLNGHGQMVIGAGGGCSTVHDHSSVIVDDKLYLAVGDHAVCISLSSPHELTWAVRVDQATCFGHHWDAGRRALIVHGELEISRLSLDGDLIWQASGADIFTESVRLQPDHVEAVDFERRVYRFDYATGDVMRD